MKQSKNIVWALKMRPIGCPETSVANCYHSCVSSYKSKDLIYTVAQASSHARVGNFGGMIPTKEKEVLGEKPVSVPLCPPQVSHGLTRY